MASTGIIAKSTDVETGSSRRRDQQSVADHEVEIVSCRFTPEDLPISSSDVVVDLNNSHSDEYISIDNSSGVCLSWEELWVIASNRKSGSPAILGGVSGYALPGEVLAIMGPSGCGKSTLLDALAGRLQSNTTQSGDILINGRRETLAFGTSAYVTQDDYLMTTLTVREAKCTTRSTPTSGLHVQVQENGDSRDDNKRDGITGTPWTPSGGRGSKGISGGQKRRVTICIEILTRPKLLFLDEPTSGLDSAASYHVMSRIVGLAQQDGLTVVLSIHHPPRQKCLSSFITSAFSPLEGLFTLVLLIMQIRLFFAMILKFFAQNGFPCPPMRNPSDHYLRTINKDFDDDVGKGYGRKPATEEATNMLITSYKSSKTYKQVKSRIDGQGFSEIPLESKGGQASFFTQCAVLTRRSFVNMYRDLGYYWFRFGIYTGLCLCLGTIFLNARGNMLMFVVTFMTFMAIGGFPSFVEDMKIFGRERLNGHYGVSAFIVGNTFSSIPYLILVSLVPGAIAYYLVGLQRGIEHFGYFTLLLFTCMMLVESLMMLVASIVPDYLMGIITGAGIQGVMILTGGFFRLRNEIPKPFWTYPMHYIAFHKYSYNGFFKNEFEGLKFPINNNQSGAQGVITGEEILRDNWQMALGYSKWFDLAILVGMVALYRVIFLVVLKATEKAKPFTRSVLAITSKQRKQVMESSTSDML
ncbi:hypothetical protein Sjap_010582 [Stephania japonica]|uniref:ABC transporter domain-containing protein n=1 Tax=Stephania japonica TaxID=461633 RepID=A0AAP0JBH1_9MAGN